MLESALRRAFSLREVTLPPKVGGPELVTTLITGPGGPVAIATRCFPTTGLSRW